MRLINKVGTYINIESSVMIIVGIFLSVIIAFYCGNDRSMDRPACFFL